MQKIIKYTDTTQNTILREEDLDTILNIRKYKDDVTNKCKKMIDKAYEDAAKIKEDAYNEAMDKFRVEQEKLMVQLESKITKSVEQINDDLYHLLYKLLHKFGIFSYKADQIKSIIEEELSKYRVKIEDISVIVNNNTFNNFKEFIDTNQLKYKINEALHDNECILESNTYLFKLNIDDAIKKIEALVNQQN